MRICACMGPMYGEPYCICKMEQMGLPLNKAARAIEDERSKAQIEALNKSGWFSQFEEDK